ncbi:MAG: short-chain dehydrogenase, partial [Actinomycetes bacterium]
MTATDGPAQDRRPGAVLVTGGASGLGAAVALAVRDAGGRPFVLDLVTPPWHVD